MVATQNYLKTDHYKDDNCLIQVRALITWTASEQKKFVKLTPLPLKQMI